MSAPSHAPRTAARGSEQREICKTTREGTSMIGKSSSLVSVDTSKNSNRLLMIQFYHLFIDLSSARLVANATFELTYSKSTP